MGMLHVHKMLKRTLKYKQNHKEASPAYEDFTVLYG